MRMRGHLFPGKPGYFRTTVDRRGRLSPQLNISCHNRRTLFWERADPMNPLAKLNRQYIGGVWREGKSQKTLTDKNPFNGAAIADFRLANLLDLDEAYRS